MDSANTNDANVMSLYRQCRYGEAHLLLISYLDRCPDDGRKWELCGIIRSAQGDQAGAIDALEKASVLVPLSHAGQYVLALNYAASGHEELAIDMLKFTLTRPKLPPSLLPRISAAFGKFGQLHLALAACRQAATIEVDGGDPFYAMAHFMERLGYPMEMVAGVLAKAVALEPNRAQFRVSLACALYQIDQSHEAFVAIRPIVDRLSEIDCPNSLALLIKVCESVGAAEVSCTLKKRLSEMN